MTVEMVEIFLQILILLAFGFLFSKRDIITDSMKNGLSTLLLKAVLPLVILSSSQVAFDGFACRHHGGGRVGCRPHQDRKSTRLNSSHIQKSRMPSSA